MYYLLNLEHNLNLRYSDPEDRNFNRCISEISLIPRETTLTISDSIETAHQSNLK